MNKDEPAAIDQHPALPENIALAAELRQDPPPGSRKGLLRLVTIDVRPLRHRDFRLLFSGQMVSFFGTMITYVALPYQIFRLTHSSLAVGIMGLVEIIPILSLAFLGGSLADARDRRRMVQLTELAFAFMSALLVVNATLPHPYLWLLYAVAAVMAGLDALQRPSLDAMLPRLVPRAELTAAAALSSLRWNIGMVAGPAVAGVLVATIGLASSFGIDVASFAVSLVALSLMGAVPPPPDAERPGVRRVAEGLRYAWGRRELMGTYLVDMVAMFFGMPEALFPALAAHYGGASVLGSLFAAPAVGSLLATVTSGWASHVRRHGLAIILAAGSWGLCVVAFGLAPALPLALVCLAAAGAADEISGLFRSTIWNQTIPDALRGRLASIEQVSYSSGPTLGNLEAGAVAALFGLRASIVSGGILCVAGTLVLGVLLPGFRKYQSSDGHVSSTVASDGSVVRRNEDR